MLSGIAAPLLLPGNDQPWEIGSRVARSAGHICNLAEVPMRTLPAIANEAPGQTKYRGRTLSGILPTDKVATGPRIIRTNDRRRFQDGTHDQYRVRTFGVAGRGLAISSGVGQPFATSADLEGSADLEDHA